MTAERTSLSGRSLVWELHHWHKLRAAIPSDCEAAPFLDKQIAAARRRIASRHPSAVGLGACVAPKERVSP